MTVISVEVPDKIAKKFASEKFISYEILFEEIENNNLFVDFWDDWISKEDFQKYLAIKNSL